MKRYPTILAIAGSDGSGGAGIQADIKTAAALGCHALTLITAVTAQNTREVASVHQLGEACLREQFRALYDDIAIDAVKIGMLGNRETVRVVSELLTELPAGTPVVLDTVLRSSSGTALLDEEVRAYFIERLFPRAGLVTPNLPEAAALLGLPAPPSGKEEVEAAARALLALGARSVLLKGGHAEGPSSSDCLLHEGVVRWFTAERIESPNTHGTGCTLSSAIASLLAKGETMEEAVRQAKAYTTAAIRHGAGWRLGHGNGPLLHLPEAFGRT
ncbi:bifunctional hydroxymethylpyrimidine kinase/phosphomethylpyrimidine kinase [Chlorobium sp. N1]|uniref:bifunctional hydroxymethylpyrimidine kinase/phosphomethylpyrimidine kinase n=1 Tax=Chlorobium sp. N1 TaxID=2491138 RepID=UPI00103D40C4|nr:bifunctional hydroxymethylpyrimidine kinase/phosphomethylpyrimidine kinase [Chlorobium sp. N1]TCD48370.1 bifunctional hydroxymethylpyrimidine kinase/phosphomethylpyrimidine kinase [Chlorobium sp. N1]